jgi:hypothetical protein
MKLKRNKRTYAVGSIIGQALPMVMNLGNNALGREQVMDESGNYIQGARRAYQANVARNAFNPIANVSQTLSDPDASRREKVFSMASFISPAFAIKGAKMRTDRIQEQAKNNLFLQQHPNTMGQSYNPYYMAQGGVIDELNIPKQYQFIRDTRLFYGGGGMVPQQNMEPAELENGETFQTPGGPIQQVNGNTHAQGGEDYMLPEGTAILGKNMSKEYKKKFKVLGQQLKRMQDKSTKLMNSDATPIAKRTAKMMLDKIQNQYDQLVNEQEMEKGNQMGMPEQYATGGIHIKKANRGKFTAYKKRTGKTTEEALHSSNPHVRQMANFARNAKKWKHPDGDVIGPYGYPVPRIQGPWSSPKNAPYDPNWQPPVQQINPSSQPRIISGQSNSVYITPPDTLQNVPLMRNMDNNTWRVNPYIQHAKGGILGNNIKKYFTGGWTDEYTQDPLTPIKGNEVGFGQHSYQIPNIEASKGIPSPVVPETKQASKFDFNNLANGIAQVAPIVYNLGQGMSKQKQFDYQKYLNPYIGDIRSAMRSRRANIDPMLEANRIAQATGNYNLRNAGASPSQLYGNLQAGATARQRSDMAAYSGQQNTNNQYLADQAQMDYYTGRDVSALNVQGYDINERNAAAKRNFMATATSQLQQYAQTKQLEKNQIYRDAQRMGLINDLFSDFKFSDKGWVFKKDGSIMSDVEVMNYLKGKR